MTEIMDITKAIRTARAIVSDISVYNEEKIKESLIDDTFFEAMKEELEEGRNLYASRVSASIDPDAVHYWHAVVNVILRLRSHVHTSIW